MNKYWGKLYCEEGVVMQHGFPTEEEAQAYVSGLNDAIEAIDPEDDFYGTCVDEFPAKDEDEKEEAK